MKKLLLSSLLVSSLSVAAVTPAFANVSDVTSTTPPTTQMTVRQQTEGYGYNPNVLTPGTVNRTFVNSIDGNRVGVTPFSTPNSYPYATNGMTPTNGIAPFNTGTGVNTYDGNRFGTRSVDGFTTNRYGTYGAYDRNRMSTYSGTRVTDGVRTNNYRAAATTTTTRRGFSWGWLGLLGLFGLAGMRSRSRDDVR